MASDGSHRAAQDERVQEGTLSVLLRDLAAAPDRQSWAGLPRPGDVVAGRFELVRELGRGGFGVVFEARDRQLQRAIAFKAVRPSGTPDVREERLLREAEAAARLSHPNIVQLHDAGRCEHGPYLILELLRGKTLAARLTEGPIDAREALRVAVGIASGVAHAHREGVVHRDLTPANVFVCDDGQVKVLDFGLAHAFGVPRAEGGTPAYMAPEQRRGAPEDERTDVFALGLILYRMLAGALPFTDGSVGRAPVVEIDEAPTVAPLVARMLAHDPVDRPRDAGEVLEILTGARPELERGGEGAHARVRRTRRIGRIATLSAVALGLASVPAWLVVRERSSAPRVALSSIAVLPFVDLSPAKDEEYFSDGIAEEILNALTQIEGLRVTGRTSSFFFKGKAVELAEIGRRLNVDAVLEGSVRKAGPRLRIAAQLVNVADGYQLWSRQFDRDVTDVFAVQTEIARAVADAMKVRFLGGSGATAAQTSSPEAHDAYLLGTHFARQASKESYRRAEQAFRRAIAKDPRYAPAHVGLSDALWGRYSAGDAQDRAETLALQDEALSEADLAVRLAPDLAGAYTQRARVLRQVKFDWAGSQADFDRALALNPNDSETLRSLGLHLAMTDRRRGIELLRRATERDPLSTLAWLWLGVVSLGDGQRAEARSALERAVQIAPEWDVGLFFLGVTHFMDGDVAAALALTDRSRDEVWRLMGRAFAAHALGRAAESRDLIARIATGHGHIAAYQVAEAYAWTGDRDRAFEWLERAYRDHDAGMTGLGFDPLLDGLRPDPRFADLLRRMRIERRER